MKLRHRVPTNWTTSVDPDWSERVEREADQHTAAAALAFAKAQRRLDRAVQQAEQEQQRKRPDKRKAQHLWELVEVRRQELLDLQRITQASPSGKQGHRPVPDMRAL